ncbi:MAG: hypothetical protein K2K93_08245 [Muribaculaceae bacterium]|nr:hypothetical protein [Muribaculaceae bacterium]
MEVRIGQEPDDSFIAYNTTGKRTTMIGTGATVEDAKEDFFNSINEIKQSYTDRNEVVYPELFEDIFFLMED